MTGEQNMRKALKSVRRYYNFELFEMLLVGVASYIQVKTLMKLLSGNSIVVWFRSANNKSIKDIHYYLKWKSIN